VALHRWMQIPVIRIVFNNRLGPSLALQTKYLSIKGSLRKNNLEAHDAVPFTAREILNQSEPQAASVLRSWPSGQFPLATISLWCPVLTQLCPRNLSKTSNLRFPHPLPKISQDVNPSVLRYREVEQRCKCACAGRCGCRLMPG
jgi:hypothetical protein